MIINETIFNTDCLTILTELQSQLATNHINLLKTISDTPNNVMISCPYHKDGQERRPSMGVRKSDGVCHCFACGETTGLPQMISYCFGDTSTIGAVGWQWLLKNFLTVSIEERKDIDLDYQRNFAQQGVSTVSDEELDSYRYTHPYWAFRGITDTNLIELFDLGYDQRTDCITFPVRDKRGRCLFVARRSVKTKYFNYPKGVEKPVYGYYELLQLSEFPKEIIICESMLDALTAWQYGKYAVALNGLGNERQFKELREMPCRKFILATDADSAGMTARKRIRKNIKTKLITEYVWNLSDAKDLNDMSKSMFLGLQEKF